MSNPCPICGGPPHTFVSVDSYHYFRCEQCTHIWLDPHSFLSPEEESKRYLLHDNNADNISYVNYLDSILSESVDKIGESLFSKGVIDYGSCNEEVLIKVLQRRGFRGYGYDPLFSLFVPEEVLPVGVVIASESAEHFYTPLTEFEQMNRWLIVGGKVFLKTSLTDTVDDFSSWWYRKDPTHVQFYSSHSLIEISKRTGFRCLYAQKNSVVLQKIAEIE